MQVQISTKNNMIIAKLIGELDHHAASKARDKLQEVIINKAIKNLVFDLDELTFMDSSGIGMIIGRYKLISALGGNVKIVCKNTQIKKLITMSGLKRIINVYDEFAEIAENM